MWILYFFWDQYSAILILKFKKHCIQRAIKNINDFKFPINGFLFKKLLVYHYKKYGSRKL
jgi:hypothetical protein